MIHERIKNNELDRLFRDALASSDALEIPFGLQERTVRKLKKKAILRELLLELAYKAGLVLGSLGILAGVYIWTNGYDDLLNAYRHLSNSLMVILPLLFVAVVTVLIDQIGIRFFDHFKNPDGVTPAP
jgi:hypothetical protein